MSQCCKTKYEALDGKMFDTEQECRKHNELPRVWVVTEGTYCDIIGIFTREKDAIALKKDMRESMFLRSIRISSEIVTLHTEVTLTERITNTKVKQSWLKQLKGLMQ